MLCNNFNCIANLEDKLGSHPFYQLDKTQYQIKSLEIKKNFGLLSLQDSFLLRFLYNKANALLKQIYIKWWSRAKSNGSTKVIKILNIFIILGLLGIDITLSNSNWTIILLIFILIQSTLILLIGT